MNGPDDISACRYSPEGIKGGLVALKGKDRAAAAVLHEAEQCGLDVGLATFRIEHLGHGYYKEHANVEMAEYELTGWTTLNGKPESYDTLSVDIDEEVIPVSRHVIFSSRESPYPGAVPEGPKRRSQSYMRSSTYWHLLNSTDDSIEPVQNA